MEKSTDSQWGMQFMYVTRVDILYQHQNNYSHSILGYGTMYGYMFYLQVAM